MWFSGVLGIVFWGIFRCDFLGICDFIFRSTLTRFECFWCYKAEFGHFFLWVAAQPFNWKWVDVVFYIFLLFVLHAWSSRCCQAKMRDSFRSCLKKRHHKIGDTGIWTQGKTNSSSTWSSSATFYCRVIFLDLLKRYVSYLLSKRHFHNSQKANKK